MGLLIDERPLVLLPSLVTLVGLERAIILQQVHFTTNQPRSGEVLDDGFKYVWNTYEDWHRDHFPFWSAEAIRKHFTKLEEQDLIIARKPNAQQRDHTKYYRVNEARLVALCTVSVTDSQSESNRPPSPILNKDTETSMTKTSPDSVPNGTGVPPIEVLFPRLGTPLPTSSIGRAESPAVSSAEQDPKKKAFDRGVYLLSTNGISGQQARKIIAGKWLKSYHAQDVATVLESLPEGIVDYVSYVTEILKQYTPKNAHLKTVEEVAAEREAFANTPIAPPPTQETNELTA